MPEEKMHQMEITQIKMKGDIEHIKDRLDNGISTTVTKIFNMLNDMAPQVKENSYWVGVWKKSIVMLAIGGVLMGSVALAFHFIR